MACVPNLKRLLLDYVTMTLQKVDDSNGQGDQINNKKKKNREETRQKFTGMKTMTFHFKYVLLKTWLA